jgi:hypothetical protein
VPPEAKLDAGRDDGDRLEHPASGLTEGAGPGQHGVADGRRYFRLSCREHLRHEEQITVRLAVQIVGIDGVCRGKLRDRFERKGCKLNSTNPFRGA